MSSFKSNKDRSAKVKASIFKGFNVGVTGIFIGIILQLIWGNLHGIEYTIYTSFLIGFVIGLSDYIFHTSMVKKLPYTVVLLFKTTIYFIIILFSIYGVLIFYLKAHGLGSEALQNAESFDKISQSYLLVNINLLYVLVIALSISFLGQVKGFFGKNVLFNYLIGKYHKPSIEERIFMFLDLNNATTLAEKLGPQKYSAFVKDFFNDIDDAIIQHRGHVFQYVGDEVVIIWKPKQGLKNNNCIEAFFRGMDIIEKNKKYYSDKYQAIPSFKAAVHIGEVSITEIGNSKKEIAYHGDTINTTARICGAAHQLGSHFLISKALYDRLPIQVEDLFNESGEHTFKGKDERLVIYSIKDGRP